MHESKSFSCNPKCKVTTMPSKTDIPNPYKPSPVTYTLPNILQLGAGPTNCSTDVIRILGSQPLTPVTDCVYEIIEDIKPMLKYIYQTNNPVTIVGQTSGNGGNETIITNLADPGETIIVAVAGVWGKKVVDMAKRYNLTVVELSVASGEVYSFQELEDAIIKHKAVVLFVTHGESSGGTLQPLEGLGDICHRHNCLLAVDAVVSLAVAPIYVDRWGIDAINGGSQKGISAPAGMCLMSFSPKAFEKILSKKHPPPYIFDVKTLAKVWNCFEKGRGYLYTYNSCMLAAVRQALSEICEEGLENVWKRHQTCGQMLANKAEADLKLKHFVANPKNRFYGVNCFELPDGIKWTVLLKHVLMKYKTEFSFGIGPTYDKAIRIGLLGVNARPEIVDYIIKILKEGIDYCRNNKFDEEIFPVNA